MKQRNSKNEFQYSYKNIFDNHTRFDLTGCDYDSQWGFEFSQLRSLLSWAFSQQDKKIKINGIINGSVTF